MNILLDTHIILWWLNDDESLKAEHRSLISNTDNLCYISAASIWEISIKSALGKLIIPSNYIKILKKEGFQELTIAWKHSEAVTELQTIHRDPFDRILIAQAQVEKFTLVTEDETIKKYNVRVI